jgi:hypothetical protein
LVRTLAALNRFGPLPTIWSSCLAGWWLGGGGHFRDLPFLFGGATLLIVGGVLLPQAFGMDLGRETNLGTGAGSPAQSRVPLILGLGLLVTGALLLLRAGVTTGVWGLVVLFLTVLCASLGQDFVVRPTLHGLARFSLYLLAASVGEQGVTGWALWCGLALGIYVAGAGYLDGQGARVSRSWAALLLLTPVALALIMDTGPFRESALLLCAVFVLWAGRCLRAIFWPSEPARPSRARDLLTGIILADWLAACPAVSISGQVNQLSREVSFTFIALFLLALLLGRLLPDA